MLHDGNMSAPVLGKKIAKISAIFTKKMTSPMSTFFSQVNAMTGKQEWVIKAENYDYHQEVARSAYADMLHDEERNKKYYIGLKKAIQKMHSEGKKANVLDIGTGTGLLSMMAARCGADSITACEAFTPVAQCARDIIKANGFGDKIKLIPKRSTQITVGPDGDMSHRANILVTEVFDTELIGEGAIGTFHHAHKCLLQEDCIVVPTAATMYVQVVQSDFTKRFNKLQPIKVPGCDDIIPPNDVTNCPGAAAVHDIQMDQLSHDQFQPITEPEKVFWFDYSGKSEIKFSDKSMKTTTALQSGDCDAIFMWWDIQMDLDGDVMLSCAPRWGHPEPKNMQWRDHWMQAVYYPPSSCTVAKGDQVNIHSFHDDYSLWFDVTKGETKDFDTEHPVCTCGVHILYSRGRIGMLNDSHRNSVYANALRKVLQPGSVCLLLGDGSFLPMLAARLGAQCYVLETNHIARRVLEAYCTRNALTNVKVINKEPSEVTEGDLDGHKVDIVLAEPYFSSSILPWHNFHMWFAMKELTNHLRDNASVLPHSATIKAIGVEFKDLWKIRAPLGICEGFQLGIFGQLIENASELADDNVEAQPLWEYPGVALTEPFDLIKLDFNKPPSSQGEICCERSVNFMSEGTCNGVALWIDYSLDQDNTCANTSQTQDNTSAHITTGLFEKATIGHQLKWDPFTRQGVHLIKPSNITGSNTLKVNSEFKLNTGDIDFKFQIL
ncbi:unnamed protein product [Owenia fusiformis]|uniref:Protein arginine N-methyltransferase n=1 Tax=Owenia fusiformis TaxID=6347 RepID=A0A8S4NHA1_OWEFU|nr:unnamed protein product [Owenia fusiformis]